MDAVFWLFGGGIMGFVLGWGIFSAKLARACAEKHMLEERFKEQQEHIKTEFRHTATGIFEEISNKFSVQSEKRIGDLLMPLRERLAEFQKMIGEHGKEQHTLKAEIGKIVMQSESLAKALRGDVKAQGNWGEVMLERILEESGLRKGTDYVVQGAEMGLTGEGGNRLQPDVVVKLPESKHIVIDSKVSLAAYDRYCSSADDAMRESCMRDFLKSVKLHVGGLEQKRYQDIDKLGTPDFVLMFMPIEGAFSLAMQRDPELHSYAWNKKVVIVCPTTLFATLRTVASLWRIESQNKNAEEIARQGGALYDKFEGFIRDMMAMGKQMTTVQNTYEQAMGKLSTGRGNLISGVEKLKQLGAKTSKSLPDGLLGDDDKVVSLTAGKEEV